MKFSSLQIDYTIGQHRGDPEGEGKKKSVRALVFPSWLTMSCPLTHTERM
jgi:hypothetical protein